MNMRDPGQVDPNPANPNPAPPADPANQVPPADPPVDPVYKRMQDDLFKQKQKAQALEDENKRLKEEKLKSTKNWEEIARLKEQEANEANTRLKGLEDSLIERDKLAALRTEAVRAGIHQGSLPDLDLLDFPEVVVETTGQGKNIVHGAAQAIQSLKLKRPHWFNSAPPSINPASPETITTEAGKLTATEVSKLQDEYRRNPTQENKKKAEDALRAYKAQN